jgi:hypothetical protein
VTRAPAGGAKTLSISLQVWISEVMDANQFAPIHLCTFALEQRISASNASPFWWRSEPLTVVCEDKSEMVSNGAKIAEPRILDTIVQLRRAK